MAKDKRVTSCQIAEEMHLNNLNKVLPHFWKVVKILATIVFTSCSSKKSFSCLRRLKTY